MSTSTRRRRDLVLAHPAGAAPAARLPQRARGFALVPAIFLIVVLASLAAFAVRLGSQQQQTISLAVQGARGLAAANAGIEWAAWRALNGTCANGSLALAEGALVGFTVDVTCSATSIAEGGLTVNSYVLEATATAGVYGGPDYVRRRVRATLAKES